VRQKFEAALILASSDRDLPCDVPAVSNSLISWLASVYPMVDDLDLLRVWFHLTIAALATVWSVRRVGCDVRGINDSVAHRGPVIFSNNLGPDAGMIIHAFVVAPFEVQRADSYIAPF
jgi:hypothetical protein